MLRKGGLNQTKESGWNGVICVRNTKERFLEMYKPDVEHFTFHFSTYIAIVNQIQSHSKGSSLCHRADRSRGSGCCSSGHGRGKDVVTRRLFSDLLALTLD